MSGRNLFERPRLCECAALCLREFTAGEDADILLFANGRNRLNEPLRVRMHRTVEDIRRAADLHEITGEHDAHTVRNLRLQRHVVADHDHGRSEILAHLGQNLQNRALGDDVQRAGGLVCNNQLGRQQRGHGNADALLHPARKFILQIRRL